MSLQIRRGTAAQLAVITPVIGELIYTTDTQQVYVGDGTTTGGIPVAVGGSGNVTGTNLLTAGVASATGNVTGGNIRTAGQVSATGNITTAGFFVGNGSSLTGITASAVDAANLTGNTIANTVLYSSLVTVGTLANASVSGNVQGGNLRTAGQVSSTGNVTGGNILTGGNISATTNVIGGNLVTGGTVSATGNATVGNLITAGQVSSTGNVTGNYLRATLDINAGGNVVATSHTGTSVSVVANVTGGNLTTVGQVTATGNVTGNYILGNGSLLTGIDASGIQNGTSNVKVSSSNGNVTVNVGGTSNVVVYATTGEYVTGLVSVTGSVVSGNLLTGGVVSATGNITGGNITLDSAAGNIYAHDIILGGVVSAVGNITGGNITLDAAAGNIYAHDLTLGGVASVTGTITGGNLTVGTGTVSIGALVNNNANGVGNIGSSSKYFNTVFAKATSAQYADLAENYTADAEYAPGTVVIFGGDNEITISTEVADERVAGAISTNPAHLMNSGQAGLPVALRGRVPVKLIGAVTKGDGLVTSSVAGYAQSVGRSRLYGQAVFAKALETDLADGEKTIIAVIL